MKETNLRVSGKIILAAAILLRLKSGRFIDFDLTQLEQMMSEDYEDEFEEFEGQVNRLEKANPKDFKIYPRTPQPRKRKVSIHDLIGALEKTLEKDKKKMSTRSYAPTPEVDLKHIDINLVIKDVEKRLYNFSDEQKTDQMKFSDLTPSDRKEDIITTFIPLLHLTNARVTDLNQEKSFDDFDVTLLKKSS